MISTIIAAAGLGLRLHSETSEIPKPLVHYKTKPIIAHLIYIYRKISDDIIVVRSSCRKGELLEAWLTDYYENPEWLKIVVQPSPAGTNDAVMRAIPFARHERLLVSWSDFILDEKKFLDVLNENETTFFLSDMECRFGYVAGNIVRKKSMLGFLGVYFFATHPALSPDHDDMIENFLDQPINVRKIDAINLGTISDLVINRSFERQSNRFFNSITTDKKFVYKTATNDHAIELQNKEVNWYNTAGLKYEIEYPKNDLTQYLPSFYHDKEKHTITLGKINGLPLSKCILDEKFWRQQLPDMLDALHYEHDNGILPAITKVQEGCKAEYIEKPQNRVAKVNNIVEAWFGDRIIINGEDYTDWKFPDPPKDLMPEKFTFIHGDLQFSNTMMDEKGNLKMIDPRGSFGATVLYGDPAYDIAKLLYATDAYHKINEGDFGLHRTADGNTILIHEPLYKMESHVKEFFELQCQKHNISKEKLNFLLFGIWMSLTSYIINDPMAVIASYCKALIRSRHPII